MLDKLNEYDCYITGGDIDFSGQRTPYTIYDFNDKRERKKTLSFIWYCLFHLQNFDTIDDDFTDLRNEIDEVLENTDSSNGMFIQTSDDAQIIDGMLDDINEKREALSQLRDMYYEVTAMIDDGEY